MLSIIIMILLLLQGVAFVTLWERHLLGVTQGRLGPNKVTLMGCLQPVFDGVKLLKKETITLLGVNKSVYYVAPVVAFVLLGCEWLVIPYKGTVLVINYGFLFILVIMGISVYPIMVSGMNTKSKYGVLGAIRSSVQTISFEVVYTLLMLSLMVFMNSYEIIEHGNLFVLCWSMAYLIAVLLELNRAPFDLSEAESELVSGYNVEYMSTGFVLFFLKEYGSLIFFSVLMSSLYLNGSLLAIYWIVTLLLYIRSCYPRIRYDMVMSLFWFILMPVSINLLFVSVVMC